MAPAMWKMGLVGALLIGVAACAEGDELSNDGNGDGPVGPPSMAVSGAESLDWEMVAGASGERQVEVENRGGQMLEVDLEVEASWLSASTTSLEVAAGDTASVQFEAQCGDRPVDQDRGTVAVTSNDPERSSLQWEAWLSCEAPEGGELEVTVDGLPGDREPAIAVSGPDGFAADTQEPTVWEDLAAGSYEVVAEDVGTSARFEPSPRQQTVDVESGERATASIDYVAVPGSVEITVEGLPAGVAPEIELRRDGQFWDVDESGVVEDLEPGVYDVRTMDVEDGGVVYQASDLEVLIESEELAEITVQYLSDPGSLEVTVQGLPSGVDHDVELMGPGGSTTNLPQSGSLTALEPGEYEIVANPVEEGPATYEASDQTVEVLSDQTASATVSYEVIPGSLEVSLAGLPAGASPILQIDGPDGESTQVGDWSDTSATPGDYTIGFDSVDTSQGTYAPDEESVDVVVESDGSAQVTMAYELVVGSLTVDVSGLPSGVDHDIAVIDGDGESTSLPQGGSLSGLAPGTYNVVAEDVSDGPAVYQGDSTTATVSSGQEAEATIEYEVITGGLEVVLNGLDAGVEPVATVEGPSGFSEELVGGGTLSDVVPGEYTVAFETVDDGGATYLPDDSSLSVTVESGETAQVSTTYQVVGLSLSVSIGGDDVEVAFEISGPGGFSETVTESSNFGDVEPGTYTLEPAGTAVDEWGNELDVTIDPGDELEVNNDSASWDVEVLRPTVVRSTSDSGAGSLRDVMESDLEAGSVVTFEDGITMVTLDGGAISVDGDIAIEGGGFAEVFIDAGNQNRHFEVQDGAVLNLFGLRLSDGYSADDGGSVWVDGGGALIVEQSDFWVNEADGDGGAIYTENGAEVLVVDSWFDENVAGGRGGAIGSDTSVSSATEVEVRRSSFENNQSGFNGGAVGLSGELVVSASTLFENTANDNGGAIYMWDGDAEIEDSTVALNHAGGNGGGVWFFGDSLTTVSLGRSVVADNSADSGGADLYRSVSSTDVESQGYNVVGIGGAGLDDGVATDVVGDEDAPVDAELGTPTLADGFTTVVPLGDGSPARDIMGAEDCVGDDEGWGRLDQQRNPRPSGAYCSAGAWEVPGTSEGFEDADMSQGSYETGSFQGGQGLQWDYDEVRRTDPGEGQGGDYYIDGRGLILDGDRDSTVSADGISGGIDSLSLLVSQAFTSSGDRRVKVYIDGVEVGESADVSVDTSTESAPYPVTVMTLEDLDVSGEFDLMIEASGDAQVVIDQVSWR